MAADVAPLWIASVSTKISRAYRGTNSSMMCPLRLTLLDVVLISAEPSLGVPMSVESDVLKSIDRRRCHADPK